MCCRGVMRCPPIWGGLGSHAHAHITTPDTASVGSSPTYLLVDVPPLRVRSQIDVLLRGHDLAGQSAGAALGPQAKGALEEAPACRRGGQQLEEDEERQEGGAHGRNGPHLGGLTSVVWCVWGVLCVRL